MHGRHCDRETCWTDCPQNAMCAASWRCIMSGFASGATGVSRRCNGCGAGGRSTQRRTWREWWRERTFSKRGLAEREDDGCIPRRTPERRALPRRTFRSWIVACLFWVHRPACVAPCVSRSDPPSSPRPSPRPVLHPPRPAPGLRYATEPLRVSAPCPERGRRGGRRLREPRPPDTRSPASTATGTHRLE